MVVLVLSGGVTGEGGKSDPTGGGEGGGGAGDVAEEVVGGGGEWWAGGGLPLPSAAVALRVSPCVRFTVVLGTKSIGRRQLVHQ